jgi:hypothetical protein
MSSSSKSHLTISTGAGDFAASRDSEQQRADMDGTPGYLHDIVEGDEEPMAFSPEAGAFDVRVFAVGLAKTAETESVRGIIRKRDRKLPSCTMRAIDTDPSFFASCIYAT